MKPLADSATAALVALGLQDDTAIRMRRAFLEFSETDIDRLRELHQALAGIGSEFIERFYEHLLRFPETRRFIPDAAMLEHLKDTQGQYFDTLTAGEYGASYISGRLRVGIAHQRIGLGTQWYIGAYAKYLVDLMPEIWQRLGENPERFIPSMQSLLKVVLLDMGLAMDTYIFADRRSLAAMHEYAEMVFMGIPDGLVVLSADFTVLSVNRAFLQQFGIGDQSLRGRHLFSVIAADGLEEGLLSVRDSGETVRDLFFDIGRVGAEGRVPVRITLTGIRLAEEEEEEEARLLMVVEDRSEPVRLQQALAESEATLLDAQAVARIGSWRVDFGTAEMDWSPEMFRIFCVPRDTPVNLDDFFARIHPNDRDRVEAAWQATLNGAPYHVQHRIDRGDGICWVEERATVEFDSKGRPVKAVGTAQDITEQKEAEARIEKLAFYDMLTGLPNRALFVDRLKHELAVAERRGQRLSLLFVDLDRFKEVNDTMGHYTGDRVLMETARRLRGAVRDEETLARISGDEFVVIVADSADASARVAERIGDALALPAKIDGQHVTLSASIGIAVFPEDGRTADDLLKHADIAMYRAKGSGGGYQLYRAEMGDNLARQVAIAKRLGRAIRGGDLHLHYQPQVHLPTGTLVGAEALTRWRDSEWGAVSPAEFIPIAEERGLIVPLGEWALHQVCRQIRIWEEQNIPVPNRVAVNVAARQFESDAFVERVISIAREHGVASHRIELEITESGMMRDPERAVEIAHALTEVGFSLSVDDFGTGYSSLSYLKRFPVSKLKIDMSFVRDMLTDRDDYAIVKTVIAMAESMELETLAEGIEHAEQAEALLALGCRLAQGYYFGRALSAQDFGNQWLRGGK